jgi:glycosyltransferase involved in cell wall biosynthesis
MNVTVVIPTYNRADRLLQTLSALNRQSYKQFTVLVIDDGSSDDTSEKVKGIQKALDFHITYIKQANGGASSAINNAIKNVKDGLIILLDDDIIAFQDTIMKHVSFHQNTSDAILSGAAEIDHRIIKKDIEWYKYTVDKKWEKLNTSAKGPLLVGFHNFVITTANMSFPKHVFDKIGGFDERLRDGYDFEFGIRALTKNIALFFDVTIKTIHNDPFTLRYYAKRQRSYMKSKEQIFAQNPNYKKYFNQNFDSSVSLIKSIIYSILERERVINFIEGSKLMLLLPKRIRYKLYGMTIAALSLSKK